MTDTKKEAGEQALALEIGGLRLDDGVWSDNIAIALCTYYSSHDDRPEPDKSGENGWGDWVTEKANAALTLIARAALQQAEKDKLDARRSAYLLGFNASGEGYNGEYPYQDHGKNPENDQIWCKNRDAALDIAAVERRKGKRRIYNSDRSGMRGRRIIDRRTLTGIKP